MSQRVHQGITTSCKIWQKTANVIDPKNSKVRKILLEAKRLTIVKLYLYFSISHGALCIFFSFCISVLSIDSIERDQVVKENAQMIEIGDLL